MVTILSLYSSGMNSYEKTKINGKSHADCSAWLFYPVTDDKT